MHDYSEGNNIEHCIKVILRICERLFNNEKIIDRNSVLLVSILTPKQITKKIWSNRNKVKGYKENKCKKHQVSLETNIIQIYLSKI